MPSGSTDSGKRIGDTSPGKSKTGHGNGSSMRGTPGSNNGMTGSSAGSPGPTGSPAWCCVPTRDSRCWEPAPTLTPVSSTNGRRPGSGSRSHGLLHSSVCSIVLTWQHLSPSGPLVLHLELELKPLLINHVNCFEVGADFCLPLTKYGSATVLEKAKLQRNARAPGQEGSAVGLSAVCDPKACGQPPSL